MVYTWCTVYIQYYPDSRLTVRVSGELTLSRSTEAVHSQRLWLPHCRVLFFPSQAQPGSTAVALLQGLHTGSDSCHCGQFCSRHQYLARRVQAGQYVYIESTCNITCIGQTCATICNITCTGQACASKYNCVVEIFYINISIVIIMSVNKLVTVA